MDCRAGGCSSGWADSDGFSVSQGGRVSTSEQGPVACMTCASRPHPRGLSQAKWGVTGLVAAVDGAREGGHRPSRVLRAEGHRPLGASGVSPSKGRSREVWLAWEWPSPCSRLDTGLGG